MAGAACTLPPGPRLPGPLATLGWLKRPIPLLLRAQERYGDVFTFTVAPPEGPWVFLSHPDAIREVFTGPPDDLRAGEGNAILEPLLGARSVLLLDGPEHLAQRRLLLPPFHGERMQRYSELMREVAQAEIATWPGGSAFALAPRMQALTLEIILRTVFGMDTHGPRSDALRDALRRLLALTADSRVFLLIAALGPRVTRLPVVGAPIRRVDELLHAEITERRTAPDLAERQDILSLLLQATHEDGSPMDDTEMRDELLTLLVAGHETTATALSWALERLLRTPQAMGRLTEEVAAGEDAYVTATIQETLRLRPVLPVVLRKLARPMTIAGHDLPSGVKVAPCIALVHRRPDVYPEPHVFRPERFLNTKPGTYTWIPFGGGSRRCLGAAFAQLEMRIVLEEVIRGASLRAGDAAVSERTARRAITLAPERGAEVVAAERGALLAVGVANR